jgi:hypothetical protein
MNFDLLQSAETFISPLTRKRKLILGHAMLRGERNTKSEEHNRGDLDRYSAAGVHL